MQNQNTTYTRRAPAWWVRAFLAIGRPAIVIVGLAMLAPAEKQLALISGYVPEVAWGMAVLMGAYGGMAAVTAAYVDRDHPGRRTAVLGALGALAAGASSQTAAHLVTTGFIHIEPRPPILLVLLPSIAPTLIIGHLLHLSWVRLDGPQEAASDSLAPRARRARRRALWGTWGRKSVVAEQLADVAELPDVADDEPEDDEDAPLAPAGLVSVREAAMLSGRQPSTVRGWIADGWLTAVRVPNDKRNYVHHKELVARGYIEEMEVGA